MAGHCLSLGVLASLPPPPGVFLWEQLVGFEGKCKQTLNVVCFVCVCVQFEREPSFTAFHWNLRRVFEKSPVFRPPSSVVEKADKRRADTNEVVGTSCSSPFTPEPLVAGSIL